MFFLMLLLDDVLLMLNQLLLLMLMMSLLLAGLAKVEVVRVMEVEVVMLLFDVTNGRWWLWS
jgi:hypothetical protein